MFKAVELPSRQSQDVRFNARGHCPLSVIIPMEGEGQIPEREPDSPSSPMLPEGFYPHVFHQAA